jgi:SH3-like domain-containing protein
MLLKCLNRSLKMLKIIPCLVLLILLSASPYADNKGPVTGLQLPRFVTLKFSETNLRKGPNSNYPIAWIFKQKGYPMEVIDEFENWRKIRDIDGNEGWVHENLISGIRSAIIVDNKYNEATNNYAQISRELVLFRYPDENSYPMLRAEIGVIAKLKSCDHVWCKLNVEDEVVWARKENLWGVYPNEISK